MKNIKHKIISLILSIATLAISCSCANRKDNIIAYPKPEQIKWGIVRYNPFIETINTSSEVLKYLAKKFNFTIDFKYYNTFNTKSLIQLLNTEDCPDILTMESMTSEGQYLAVNNLAIPANEIIDDKNYSGIPQTTLNLLSEYDNILYGIPGRYADESQLKNDDFPKNEGVYVCKQYYDLLGRPKINTMGDLINISQQFIEQYNTFEERFNNIEYNEIQNNELIPILLGSTGSGIETLKHLFGIYPVYEKNGEVMLSTSSPRWQDLLNWLNRLSFLSDKSMSVSNRDFSEILNGKNLFYIGSAPGISKINYSNKFTYELLNIGNTRKTYSVNPYGSCQTYVLKKCDAECIRPLMNFLFSTDGNLLVKFGIENKHWIKTDDSALQLNWVIEKFKNGDDKFRTSSGIGQLMFLTNLNNDNTYIPDLLSTEKNAFYSIITKYNFHSNESIKLNKLNELEMNLCQRMASTNPSEYPEKYSLIMTELPYLAVQERQYHIESLKDKYVYWHQQSLYDSDY